MLQQGGQQLILPDSLKAGQTHLLGDLNLTSDTIWDPLQARLGVQILPVIGAIPFFVTVIISACFMVRWLHPKLPSWLTIFVSETDQGLVPDNTPTKPRAPSWSIALFVVSTAACMVQMIGWARNTEQLPLLFIAASWALASILVILIRPAFTSWSLLALYIAILVSQIVVLSNDSSQWRQSNVLDGICILAGIVAIAIAINMPMRPPCLRHDGISPVGEKPTNLLRTPEDDITLWQWMTVSWMAPLISVGKFRQLEDGDIWSLGFEFQHRRLHDSFRVLQGSVLRRLLDANGLDLIILCALGVIELLAFCSQPILLQQLLASMENPDSPDRAVIIFAVLYFTASFIDSQCCCFGLWIGRRAYERSRGEMITMMYEKALTRKLPTMPSMECEEDLTNNHQEDSINQLRRFGAFAPMYHKAKLVLLSVRKLAGKFSNHQTGAKSKEPASTGKILNLVKSDVYEVAQLLWETDKYIKRPAHIIVSIFLIWKLLGPASLLGALSIILGQVVTAVIARSLIRWEKLRRVATDVKLQAVSQFVEAIRHLRWYGWQKAWQDQVTGKRKKEQTLRVVTGIWNMLIALTDSLASGMFPVISFFAYTILLGKPLRLDLAFPALYLFRNLEYNLKQVPRLITKLLNAYIALQRVEDFVNEPNKPEAELELKSGVALQRYLSLKNASFAWPGKHEPILSNVSLTFQIGLNVISGKVAAGKTALLLALLGELDQVGGESTLPNDPVGYCAQIPWLQSMSIRDNILFYTPYDEGRYKKVLDACALTPDLANLRHGDQSVIGENGIGLSGGQRARVALARAFYGSAKTLILDDPLSALDHQTAKSIVQKGLKSSLVRGRTVILVTHRLDICHDAADQLIEVADGGAYIVTGEADLQTNPRIKDPDDQETDETELTEEIEEDGVPNNFFEEERRESGTKYSVYWEYVKAGKVRWWLCLIFFLAANRVITVGQSWFMKEWGEAYNRVEERSTPIAGFFDTLPDPETNVHPWLIGFLLIAIAQTIANLVTQGLMLTIIYFAGKRLFRDVLQRVACASFRFYDVTPTGRLMNRMISDMGMIDGNIGPQFQEIAELATNWITSIVVIASVTPIFFVYSLAMTAAFIYFFLRFLPTSHSLRRLGMISLSPLMSDIGALADGLTTIRAFCVQSQFQSRVIYIVDTFQKTDHFYWSLQAWLIYRFDLLADVSVFFLIMIALYTRLSPGLAAFTLISAQQFVEATQSLCTSYGQLQMDLVSVERIVELLRIEQEPQGEILPPASWPHSSGDLSFSDVTIRYAPHLDPAIENVSFAIKGGSTTAIIGRTGSGKSTLALSLIGVLHPDVGSVTIDGIDISKVNKQALRSRVTFLAQDPILFAGALRANLDPLNEHSDASCSRVLSRVAPSYGWTLQTAIDTGGHNLSQGQRQLIGIARAILRQSSIVILDEATASIDLETSMEAQQTVREVLQGATLVTVAHRVEAVRGAERYIALDKGRLLEEGRVGKDGEFIAERPQRGP